MKRVECFNHFKYEFGPSFESEDVDLSELDDKEPELDDYMKSFFMRITIPVRLPNLLLRSTFLTLPVRIHCLLLRILLLYLTRQKVKSPTTRMSVDWEICPAVVESGQDLMMLTLPMILHLLVLFGLCLWRLTSMSRMSRLDNLVFVMICSSCYTLGLSAILLIPDKKLYLLSISFCQIFLTRCWKLWFCRVKLM